MIYFDNQLIISAISSFSLSQSEVSKVLISLFGDISMPKLKVIDEISRSFAALLTGVLQCDFRTALLAGMQPCSLHSHVTLQGVSRKK